MKKSKSIKKFFLVLLLIALGLTWYFLSPIILQDVVSETEVTEEKSPDGKTTLKVPEFREIELDFTHKWNKKNLAFAGGALIDIDNDGVQEIFITGGLDQEDALFKYTDDEKASFTNIIEGTGLSSTEATYGALSLDFDLDEDTDLLIAREAGLSIYYNENGSFTEQKLEVTFAEDTVPLTITAGDINKDSYADLYVSTFIEAEDFKSATFNNMNHGKPNIMLLNNGDNTFTDITEESGLAVKQNTFLSAFVDLDNDTNQDLVVSENTGQVRIFKNLGQNATGKQFEEVEVNTGFGFWMGLAIDDIDQDGDMDIFATNSGNTVPANLARGDLKDDMPQNLDWILLRNEGNFSFTDATEELGLSGFEFAWGALFEDFNLDGLPDLTVLENYIKWPAHKISKAPGRFFIQDFEGKFLPTTKQSGIANEYYGNSPLVSDFNKDGAPDLVFINLDGPSRAFLNNSNSHHFLKVELPDRASSIGTRVELTKNNGTKLTKQMITGLGLLSDLSSELTFGLGADKSVKEVKIYYPSGNVEIFENPVIDAPIIVGIKEESQ